MGKGRLEAFSDGVIAIIITIRRRTRCSNIYAGQIEATKLRAHALLAGLTDFKAHEDTAIAWANNATRFLVAAQVLPIQTATIWEPSCYMK